MADDRDMRAALARWAKLLVPVLALILLSTLFLLTGSRPPPVPDLARDTLRAGGERLEQTAREIATGRERGDRAVAGGIALDLAAPDGTSFRLAAKEGDIRLAEDKAEFWNAVEISTSTGYVLRADRLHADLDTLVVESVGPVTGEGPAGTLSADSLLLRPDRSGAGGHVLVFKGSVRLVYQPGR